MYFSDSARTIRRLERRWQKARERERACRGDLADAVALAVRSGMTVSEAGRLLNRSRAVVHELLAIAAQRLGPDD